MTTTTFSSSIVHSLLITLQSRHCNWLFSVLCFRTFLSGLLLEPRYFSQEFLHVPSCHLAFRWMFLTPVSCPVTSRDDLTWIFDNNDSKIRFSIVINSKNIRCLNLFQNTSNDFIPPLTYFSHIALLPHIACAISCKIVSKVFSLYNSEFSLYISKLRHSV